MSDFTPRDPDFEARVRASFARQAFMAHLGVEIAHLAPGEVDLSVGFDGTSRSSTATFMPA